MEKIESVVASINEKNRENEEINKLYELQQKFVAGEVLTEESFFLLPKKVEIVSPTRKFLKEGTLKEIKGINIYEVQYFLFNDLVVRAKRK
jgi:hypothetical protein